MAKVIYMHIYRSLQRKECLVLNEPAGNQKTPVKHEEQDDHFPFYGEYLSAELLGCLSRSITTSR